MILNGSARSHGAKVDHLRYFQSKFLGVCRQPCHNCDEACSGRARDRFLSSEKPGTSTQRLLSAGTTATLPAGGWQGWRDRARCSR
ncbi:hypothetical protein CGRA01v4_08559 [Colletotrichum graminicola]|nr:hypothetical protein CGRA01v4_08559 [Colletotrichum graminicola]